MKKFIVLAAFAVVGAMPVCQVANAQTPMRTPVSVDTAVTRHVQGLALARRGDEKGAFVAFLDAAEHGYPPAQRKLGEIYDNGNSAVERNYEESIRWYQRAREGGEEIPSPKTYGTPVMSPIRIGP